jgi:hypothetical protein
MSKANPYVYADNNTVNEVDPSGAASFSGSSGAFQWTFYANGNSYRLWINSPLATALSIVGGIVLGGIGAIVGGLIGSGVGAIILGGIGAIVGGVIGSLSGLYDLYCGGTGVYINFSPDPSLSPAC